MRLDDRRARRLMVAAALAGIVLRLAFGLLYWTGKPLTHDEREYLSLAGSLAAGRGFVYDTTLDTGTGQQFGRAPGYPLLLAAIGATAPGPAGTPLAVKVAQALVGGIGVWIIGLIALSAGGARAGSVAAWIAAVYPPLVTLPSYVLSETLYSTLALASAAMLQRADPDAAGQDGGLARTGLAGALAGVAALVRPAMLFFLPLAAVWLICDAPLRAGGNPGGRCAPGDCALDHSERAGPRSARAHRVGRRRDVLDRQPPARHR